LKATSIRITTISNPQKLTEEVCNRVASMVLKL
jgi:hypothetical protein